MRRVLSWPGPAVVVAVWTFLVWTGRIRNIWADDELTTTEQWWRTALALVMTAGAVAVLASLRTSRAASVVRGFAVLTTVVWVVRDLQILLGDWEAGFKVVHTVLAVGSIALVWWADRSVPRGDDFVGDDAAAVRSGPPWDRV